MQTNNDYWTNEAWIKHMRRGAFEEAWKLSDRVLESGIYRDYANIPRHYQSIWDGTPLHGKRVLIRCYHGLGDTIQFIRYAPLVREIASEVIVWAQPELIELLKTVSGIDRLFPLTDSGAPDVEFDVDIEVMELPYLFRTTLSSIPQNIPYIHVDPLFLSSEKNLSIGLVWNTDNWDINRCVPFYYLEELSNNRDINIYILQTNANEAGWKKGFGIHPGEFSLFDYARLVSGLDLIIAIDSMIAHLAGALNIPVWTMLPFQANWRWMEHRSDSPWYGSMKLFRQKSPGDWTGVIKHILAELRVVTEQWKKYYLQGR